MLNGGWAAWEDGKYPVQTESKGPFFKATTPKLTPAEEAHMRDLNPKASDEMGDKHQEGAHKHGEAAPHKHGGQGK